ncbi:MAG: PadR family transcriptional regulator [Anaerolineae bacterium]|jgi:PadR family transcriptional regulator PadR|nr:PadR family transcriptional regulator [Chloroflexota bacterium]
MERGITGGWHGRGHGRGPGGHAAGPRPRRIRRFVEPAVLLQLQRAPAHGYALLEGLQELGLEGYPLEVSSVYRVLYHLEEQGMLTSSESSEGSGGPPRRVYALTDEGCALLHQWAVDLRLTAQILQRFLEAYAAQNPSGGEGLALSDPSAAADGVGSREGTQAGRRDAP